MSGLKTSYSFDLSDVVSDLPMLDLTSPTTDGTRAVTIAAFGVRAIFIPLFMGRVAAIETRKPVVEDLPQALRATSLSRSAKVVFLDKDRREFGYLLCSHVLMLSHDTADTRIAFNNEEISLKPSTRVLLNWPNLGSSQPQEFVFPDDGSLYSASATG